MSSPVSYSVPLKISTSDSVGEWDGPIDIEEIEVSIISAPASTALTSVATDMPVVEWECTCTGRSTAFLIALTRS